MSTIRPLLTALLATAAAVTAQHYVATAPEGESLLVWDADRARVVAFEWIGRRVFEWDGAEWTVVFDARLAAATEPFAAFYDPVRRRAVTLRLAWPQDVVLDAWDGVRWTTSTFTWPLPLPVTAHRPPTAYDTARQRLVVFEGNDVLEWDGSQWIQQTPSTSPGPRDAAMAYDPVNQRTLLYGGNATSELWSWDGSGWTLLQQNAPPGARDAAALAFEPGTGRMILYGGDQAPHTTWSLQGATWTQIATTQDAGPRAGAQLVEDGTGLLLRGGDDVRGVEPWRFASNDWSELPGATPVPHFHAMLVQDPVRDQIVMFGGDTGLGGPPVYGDTWTFDRRWRRWSPAVSPSPRSHPGGAWSAVDGAVLLFGGDGAPNDTWLWSPPGWTLAPPATAPPARMLHGMAADPNGGVLLYGGQSTAGALLGDHWTWNGTTWQQITLPAMPTARGGVLAALDPVRNRVVMTGSPNPGPGTLTSDTWEWDGGQWSQHAQAPFGGSIHAFATRMTWDPDLGRIRAEGGYTSTYVYTWDGTAWTAINSSVLTRDGSRIVGDAVRKAVLRYPVFHSSAGSHADVEVVTASPASATRYGNGCSLGTVPGIVSYGRPAPGEFGYALVTRTFAPGAATAVAVGFSQQSQPLGSGCSLLVDAVAAVHVSLAGPGGDARSPIPIPPDNNLRGVTLLAQAAVVDPVNALYGPVTVSDGLRIRIGD